MNHQKNDGEETPQGSEDDASQIRLGQEGCDVLHHDGGSRIFGSAVQYPWGQPLRTSGDACQGNDFPRGGEIIGGTFSQLIKDCKDQIAGNNQIIVSLQQANSLLEERLAHYEQILSQIEK
ncbi:MAG: hypothetical protein RMZ41_003025 [Nostoc sp. DedVER02]|uniref:hypothetical protein n=1 Tax=unclassified Nostoc TaxID=2593658 RepID=UPI002AD4240B|nr:MULTISPECIES: hypothetical protein [unclassified Nostoc]MDZ7986871.1 hypothetical protein [Nostoc sp. DedVER02]MDZ8115773.1 hypothetical protein [Nostoc sp. DedVER01b]